MLLIWNINLKCPSAHTIRIILCLTTNALDLLYWHSFHQGIWICFIVTHHTVQCVCRTSCFIIMTRSSSCFVGGMSMMILAWYPNCTCSYVTFTTTTCSRLSNTSPIFCSRILKPYLNLKKLYIVVA